MGAARGLTVGGWVVGKAGGTAGGSVELSVTVTNAAPTCC